VVIFTFSYYLWRHTWVKHISNGLVLYCRNDALSQVTIKSG